MKSTEKWFEVEYSEKGRSSPHFLELGRYESAQQARKVQKEDYGGDRVVHKVRKVRLDNKDEPSDYETGYETRRRR